jgi:hypothetical protein
MLELVSNARCALDRRLADLDIRLGSIGLGASSRPRQTKPGHARSVLRTCLLACRSCGRALGAALRVAKSVADDATVSVLYRALRSFEKQLWLLDPRLI